MPSPTWISTPDGTQIRADAIVAITHQEDGPTTSQIVALSTGIGPLTLERTPDERVAAAIDSWRIRIAAAQDAQTIPPQD